jgi:hypothetical protein
MNETLTADDVINEIAEVLREADGDFIELIANSVLTNKVKYVGDSFFEREAVSNVPNE